MDGAAKLVGRKIPELPDLGDAPVASVIRDTITGAGEGATRRAVGIAAGKTWASDKVQKPVGRAVQAATGEKI